jgi:hypothetical protein
VLAVILVRVFGKRNHFKQNVKTKLLSLLSLYAPFNGELQKLLVFLRGQLGFRNTR